MTSRTSRLRSAGVNWTDDCKGTRHFGAGYIAEDHADDEHFKPPAVGRDTQFGDFMKSLCMLVGGEPAITKR